MVPLRVTFVLTALYCTLTGHACAADTPRHRSNSSDPVSPAPTHTAKHKRASKRPSSNSPCCESRSRASALARVGPSRVAAPGLRADESALPRELPETVHSTRGQLPFLPIPRPAALHVPVSYRVVAPILFNIPQVPHVPHLPNPALHAMPPVPAPALVPGHAFHNVPRVHLVPLIPVI